MICHVTGQIKGQLLQSHNNETRTNEVNENIKTKVFMSKQEDKLKIQGEWDLRDSI